MDFLASLIHNLRVTNGSVISSPEIKRQFANLDHSINPYWKLALVFKCLTDNIMLDDFKTALRKLGAHKYDANGGPQLRGFPGSSEKMSGHEMNQMENPLERLNTRERQTSLSGRALEADEVLDSSGRGRRKTSVATPLGRVGTRIAELPPLPTRATLSGWTRTAKEKARASLKRRPGPSSTPETSIMNDEPDEGPENEQVDFITMMRVDHLKDRRRPTSASIASTSDSKAKKP